MARIGFTFGALGLLSLVSAPISACSLCGSAARRIAFSQEWDRSQVVVVGRAVASRLTVNPGALPGSGSTDFEIETVLKSHPFLGKKREVTLNCYIPVLDPKAPAVFLAFFDVSQEKLDFQAARQVRSKAIVAYLDGAQALRGKSRVDLLLYYSRFLDHEDEQVAEDAFLEFARSTDQEVGAVTKRLTPERFRTLLKNPKLDAERISLFAFLLGSCGGAADAEFLKGMLDQPGAEASRALDGILAGYTVLRPRDGWEQAVRILSDAKKPFHHRHAVVRMIRFYHGWKPVEFREEIVQCYRVVIRDGELADFAIEDLREWKSWDLTGAVLTQFSKSSHQAPILRRAIVRYALVCPLPEARKFVETVRGQDRELVRELEEDLAFENKK